MNSLLKLLGIGALSMSLGAFAAESADAPEQTAGVSRTDLMYHILVAELAVKRGKLDEAFSHYHSAADASADSRIVARAASIALFLNRFDAALKLTQRWYALEPDNERARQAWILVLLHNKRVPEAVERLDEVLREAAAQGDNEGFDVVSRILSEIKDPDTVYRVGTSLRQRHSGSAYAQYFYALTALDAGQAEQALQGLDAALEIKPDWHEARLLKARVMVENGQAEQALAELEQILQTQAGDYQLRLGYARLLVAAERLDEAREQFEALAEQKPKDAEALFALGILAFEAGQYDDAERYYRRVLELGKRLSQTYFELGKVEEQRHNYREARQWYRKVDDDERFLSAQVKAAEMSARLGDWQTMHQRMNELRADNPDSAVSLHIAEADVLRKEKRYQQAFEHLNKALEERPDDPDLLYARALAAERIDRLDVVERDLKLLIEEDPENGHALNALGYTLADRTDRYQEALGYLERAIKLLPEDAAVLDSMGWIKYRLGDYEQALDYLRKAYERNQDPEIVSHLSEVLWQAGRHEEARAVWREAFAKDPDSEHLLKLQKRFDFEARAD